MGVGGDRKDGWNIGEPHPIGFPAKSLSKADDSISGISNGRPEVFPGRLVLGG